MQLLIKFVVFKVNDNYDFFFKEWETFIDEKQSNIDKLIVDDFYKHTDYKGKFGSEKIGYADIKIKNITLENQVLTINLLSIIHGENIGWTNIFESDDIARLLELIKFYDSVV